MRAWSSKSLCACVWLCVCVCVYMCVCVRVRCGLLGVVEAARAMHAKFSQDGSVYCLVPILAALPVGEVRCRFTGTASFLAPPPQALPLYLHTPPPACCCHAQSAPSRTYRFMVLPRLLSAVWLTCVSLCIAVDVHHASAVVLGRVGHQDGLRPNVQHRATQVRPVQGGSPVPGSGVLPGRGKVTHFTHAHACTHTYQSHSDNGVPDAYTCGCASLCPCLV